MTAAKRFEVNRWPESKILTGRQITVDLDDVLGDYMQGFLDFYNVEHGTRFLKSDLISYDLAYHLSEEAETIDRLVNEYAQTQ